MAEVTRYCNDLGILRNTGKRSHRKDCLLNRRLQCRSSSRVLLYTYWYRRLEMATEGFHLGSLVTQPANWDITRLLYKNGESDYLVNWRSITLLNTNYKIIAKSLADRLKTVFSRVIILTQRVPYRRDPLLILLIQDCLYYCEQMQTSAAVVLLELSTGWTDCTYGKCSHILDFSG